jgi:signal transduction histidine kinase
MQQSGEIVTNADTRSTWNGIERRQVEKVVQTLATSRSRGDSLSEVAHDARNMVTALALYCDLLDEPGVLATAFTHYAHELRLVAAASRRLVEKLVTLDSRAFPDGNARPFFQAVAETSLAGAAGPSAAVQQGGGKPSAADTAGSARSPATNAYPNANPGEPNRRWDLMPALPISNLAAELLANRNLLAALAGPAIVVTVEADGGAQAVRLTGEDLTRLLVNLVKNAVEAMPDARTHAMTETRTQNCRIHIGLRECEAGQCPAPCLALTVEDNGPGIAEGAHDRIFTSGYTSRGRQAEPNAGAARGGDWPQNHRGLGLAIVRSIVEGAGGRITVANRTPRGACFTLELPVRVAGR